MGPEAAKFDADKLPLHLLPPDGVEAVGEVLQHGAKKYGERNWEKGMDWSRCYGAALRHLFAWWMGNDRDEESGLPHLAHAACCVLFLLSYALRKTGTDDRPVPVMEDSR
jgi:hypothetical protein